MPPSNNPPMYGNEQPQIVVVPGGGARYLPAYFDGQQILYRTPWEMNGRLSGEQLPQALPNSFVAVPGAQLQNSTDKPFEIHDVIVAPCALANDVPAAEPAPGIGWFTRLSMKATSINEELTNADTLLQALCNRDSAGGSFNWPWYMPFTITNQQGFLVKVANLMAGNAMRFEIVFRGYLLVLGPATQRGG